MTRTEPRALLKIPREEARERLLARIEEGRELIACRVMSDAQFNKLEQEQDKWRAYNRELLARQLFTTDEYADECQSSFLLIHIVDDRYITPSLGILADRLGIAPKARLRV